MAVSDPHIHMRVDKCTCTNTCKCCTHAHAHAPVCMRTHRHRHTMCIQLHALRLRFSKTDGGYIELHFNTMCCYLYILNIPTLEFFLFLSQSTRQPGTFKSKNITLVNFHIQFNTSLPVLTLTTTASWFHKKTLCPQEFLCIIFEDTIGKTIKVACAADIFNYCDSWQRFPKSVSKHLIMTWIMKASFFFPLFPLC